MFTTESLLHIGLIIFIAVLIFASLGAFDNSQKTLVGSNGTKYRPVCVDGVEYIPTLGPKINKITGEFTFCEE